jgi:hypothetical protein
MKLRKSLFSITIKVIFAMSITACSSAQTPAADAQVTNVTESELVTGQITQTKTFNQCDSSSVFRTQVQFSDSNAQTNQQQLVLGAEVTGGGEIPGAVKLAIKGSVEKHFSETLQQGQAHFESANIEVPAHMQQEYTIVWQETRRNGTVEYKENGVTKSTSYSYRVGLELISTSGKDIPCSEQESASSINPSSLKVRKPAHDEIRADVPISIWDDNNISVDDMHSPGRKVYFGHVQMGMEYLFPVYWCANSEDILRQNMDNIETVLLVNGEAIPENHILTYDVDSNDGWKCTYVSVVLSGWTVDEKYKMEARRTFLAKIFDGQTNYPAGVYIYELNITVR